MENNLEKSVKQAVEFVANERAKKIDAYVKLHIKPRPKYLPYFIWEFLLKKLLVLSAFDK